VRWKRAVSSGHCTGREVGDYWDEHVETMSREQLAELQFDRLRAQLERCQSASLLYRRKFDEVGFELGDLRELTDVARLPVVTKDDLRNDQLEHPPFGTFAVAAEISWRELHPSSGTTGVPVKTL
jgi:phenylacetate-CoA ligase